MKLIGVSADTSPIFKARVHSIAQAPGARLQARHHRLTQPPPGLLLTLPQGLQPCTGFPGLQTQHGPIQSLRALLQVALLGDVQALLLAQGGEFAFVVFQAAAGARVLPNETASLLIGAVALSMLLSPLLLVLFDKYLLPRFAVHRTDLEELSEPQEAPVIICGFGRYGQIVGRMVNLQGIQATVLDHDADTIDAVRAFGFRVHYGDATRLDLLRTAGAASAKVIVVAVDGIDQSLKIVDMVQEHFPHLSIVARARNVTHL